MNIDFREILNIKEWLGIAKALKKRVSSRSFNEKEIDDLLGIKPLNFEY